LYRYVAFWKQQHIERYLELEKIHEGVKSKLDTVLNGNGGTARSVSAGTTGEDVEAGGCTAVGSSLPHSLKC
jgi:hypothetical protein